MRINNSHKALQGTLRKYYITHDEIADQIGRSRVYVSERMNDKKPWTTDDIYAICALVNAQAEEGEPQIIPHDKIAEYFPPRRKVGVRQGA